MKVLDSKMLQIRTEHDVIRARKEVRSRAQSLGFGLVGQTKLVTAASELARNTLIHGGGGTMIVELVTKEKRKGVRLTFEDQGVGILDIEQALEDGYTTGDGLGLGLGGAKRLVNEFSIRSNRGQGTHISIVRWK